MKPSGWLPPAGVRRSGAAWLLAVLVATALPATAQQQAPSGTQPGDPDPQQAASDPSPVPVRVSRDIVVVGEKAGRSVQDTHSGISVVTDEDIEVFGVEDLRDSLRLQPNVLSTPGNNSNNGISIRGVNSEGVGDPGGQPQPLVSLVIDGATQSLEGIRRGARGLWDVEQVEVLRGPQSTVQGRNALAGAVIVETKDPTFHWEGAARAEAGFLDARDDGVDNRGGALALSGPLWDDQLAFRVAGEVIRDDRDIAYGEDRLERSEDGFYWSGRAKLLFRPKWVPGLELLWTTSRVFDDPGVSAVDGPDPFARRLEDANLSVEGRRNDVTNHILDIGYALNEGISLRSITTWTETDVDFDTPTDLFVRNEFRDDTDIQQEFRVNYATERISGVAGLFYGRYENDRDSVVEVVFVPGFPPVVLQDLESERKIDNVGVFFDGRARVWRGLSVQFGLRYDWEELDNDFFNRQTMVRDEGETTYNAWLPKASLVYAFTEDLSIAATASRGYRAGFVQDGRSVDPEFAWNYEASLRSSWCDGKAILNVNAFYMDWTDQQVTGIDPDVALNAGLITENVGKSQTYGFELQSTLEPIAGLRVQGSVGYLHTRLEEFRLEGSAGTTFNVQNTEFPEAPHWTASARASYLHETGLSAAVDWTYRTGFFATNDIGNSDLLRVSGWDEFNLRLGYESEYYTAVFFVENLFNTEFLTGRDVRGGQYIGDPRTFGFQARLRF